MRPSYNSGFARYAADSKYPELWRGLRGAWCPFLGNTGPDLLRDVSGHHNHGTLVNGPTWAPGKDGSALKFVSGSSQYVEKDIQLVSSYPFTIAAWVNPDDITNARGIFALADKDVVNIFYTLGFYDGNVRLAARNTGYQEVTTPALGVGVWHHIVAVFESDTVKRLYLNGEYRAVLTNSVTYSANIDRFSIGRWGDSSPSDYFDGLIDSVSIYNRTLSAGERQQLYGQPHAMFEYADIPYARVAVAANDLLLLTQTNLRGNLHVLQGGLK